MKKLISFTPNTGGAVSAENTIGRDAEIKDFWEILKTQSIALFAERRFGKSSILRKMETEGKDNFVVIYKPVEGFSTIDGFVSAIIERVKEKGLIDESFTKKLENVYNKASGIVDEVGTVKFKKIQYAWQNQLLYLFEKLIAKNEDKVIVLMLDEFSIFIDKLEIKKAADVIGFFRDVTFDEQFGAIRFVYCGSIGIDLVLDKIKKDINIGEPINHMRKYELQPFTEDNALYFCRCLNLGCKLSIEDDLLVDIYQRTDRIPFFIDIVFNKLRNHNVCGTKEIDTAFEEIIDDTKGKDSIKHFCDRIDDYYPNPDISNYILNFISNSHQISLENEICNSVSLSIEGVNRLKINKELERLRNDGYLIRVIDENQRFYDFKFSLLKLWWQRNKAF